MVTIVTRAGKGSPLTNTEMDANFQNLDDGKLELIVRGTTSTATISPACSDSQYNVTALAVDASIEAPSGTPQAGQKFLLRIKDNGTVRSLSWNAIYRGINLTLPTTTTAGKTTYIGCIYNATDSKWDVTAVVTEA